jgi:S-formylglutathione hydrolase FrmB
LKGQIKIDKIHSKILKNNPLKDPYIRDIITYLPENYSKSLSKGYPTVFLLPAFGNNSYSAINNSPFSLTIFQILENLISEKRCGEMIIVVVDCFNKFGGSQYLNSNAIGRYKDYILEEIIPFINSKYNAASKSLLGKSSGGYGAITIGMEHPKMFKAIAAHSFDSSFEYCYLPDFPLAFKEIKKAGGPKKWLANFWNKENKNEKNDFVVLNVLSMSAHYSPKITNGIAAGINLPFDMETGELNEQVWIEWKKKDPIKMIDNFNNNLKNLDLLFFDCGINDEFNLFIGTKVFSEKCKRFGIKHEFIQYNGGHYNTSFRYASSLSKIYKSIS